MQRIEETSGTFLQGYIHTTKAELTKTFGEPTSFGEGDKVTIEWGIRFSDGTVATVYDWKRERSPLDNEEMNFNIGGFDSRAVELVEKSLSNKNPIGRSLFVEGREWFDKINGNSYFSARIWIDGGQVAILTFQYGYGEQYLYEAQKKLLELGYISQENKNNSLWSIASTSGFDFYSSKTSTNKKEMFKKYEMYSEKAVL